MRTQRVNAYMAGGRTIYFIEQLNPRSADWVTVGDVTQDIHLVTKQVENFNLRELVVQLKKGDK